MTLTCFKPHFAKFRIQCKNFISWQSLSWPNEMSPIGTAKEKTEIRENNYIWDLINNLLQVSTVCQVNTSHMIMSMRWDWGMRLASILELNPAYTADMILNKPLYWIKLYYMILKLKDTDDWNNPAPVSGSEKGIDTLSWLIFYYCCKQLHLYNIESNIHLEHQNLEVVLNSFYALSFSDVVFLLRFILEFIWAMKNNSECSYLFYIFVIETWRKPQIKQQKQCKSKQFQRTRDI